MAFAFIYCRRILEPSLSKILLSRAINQIEQFLLSLINTVQYRFSVRIDSTKRSGKYAMEWKVYINHTFAATINIQESGRIFCFSKISNRTYTPHFISDVTTFLDVLVSEYVMDVTVMEIRLKLGQPLKEHRSYEKVVVEYSQNR